MNTAIITITTILVPTILVARYAFRFAKLRKAGWNSNSDGELVFRDEYDFIGFTELFFSTWKNIVDEHPILVTERDRAKRGETRKGGATV